MIVMEESTLVPRQTASVLQASLFLLELQVHVSPIYVLLNPVSFIAFLSDSSQYSCFLKRTWSNNIINYLRITYSQ